MKKIMIIPLVICIILALPLSVYAATIDDVVSNVGYSTSFSFVEYPSEWETQSFLASSPIGFQPHHIIVDSLGWNTTQDYPNYTDLYTYISIDHESDIYMCWPLSYSSTYTNALFIEYDGNSLDLYHDPAGDFIAYSQVYYEAWIDLDWENMTAFTGVENVGHFSPKDFLYIKFVNVPPGVYKFKSPDPYYTGIDGTWTQPSTFWGFFVNEEYADFDYFDIWYNPDDPLQVQLDSINEVLLRGLESATNIDYEHFYTTFATYQLQSVIAQAEFEDQTVVNGFNDTVSDIVTNYASSGSVDSFVDSLTALSSAYTDVLSDCQTIEGGKYASGIYQARQQQLFIYAQLKAGEKLDSAISDDELQRADDYYALERELLAEISLQDMQDMIDYQTWLNLMQSSDRLVLKSIYDWFFTDSVFKFWLVIPITLCFVTLLLNTRISLRNVENPRGGSRGGHYTSDKDGRVWWQND